MAGSQPLIGATVQLYAAGTTGNGSAGTALLTPAVNTDSSGNFSVSAGYPCPNSASLIYLVARGGKAGAAASSANSAIAFVTALGACSKLSATITVNEVTTAAAVYALSQFLAPGANLGSSSTNIIGLQNAFDTAAALANVAIGDSPGVTFASNGSSPSAAVNTVADILNACAASSSGAACSTLFSATTQSGAVAPNSTLEAALNITRNPAANVPALFALSSASGAFTPVLPAAPTDFTLYIDYSGGGMNQPSGLGIDSTGNVWVASYGNTATLFSPLGKPVFPNGIIGFGLSASYGLAVDASNNAWIPNEPSAGITGNSVSVLNPSGQSIAGANGFTSGGLNYPIAVAIDPDSSVWVVDYGNSHLTHLSSAGQALSGSSGYSSPQIAFPVAAAVDSSHNVWVANQSSATITRVSSDGSQFTSYACCNAPSNLAIDRQGNVWVSNFYSDSISEVSASGIILSNGYTGGGLSHPQSIAIDGAGNLWIANYRGLSITELAGASSAPVAPGTALSPAAGLGGHAALRQAYAIAIDASGNLWVSNFGSNTITEFVGIATPVRTPLIGPPVTP
jgi:streptogramin lyase